MYAINDVNDSRPVVAVNFAINPNIPMGDNIITQWVMVIISSFKPSNNSVTGNDKNRLIITSEQPTVIAIKIKNNILLPSINAPKLVGIRLINNCLIDTACLIGAADSMPNVNHWPGCMMYPNSNPVIDAINVVPIKINMVFEPNSRNTLIDVK